ncbi:right-handed parallel beta-helix repeat-containing protein [Robiginitalea sp. IMCC43444]|uniref:right-handed parallel beta-helix repeat-containing protein n=1 Tax=Robiginitalea sp. IMCC43444 TaxID=3459121 RepID=UPI004041EA18
MKKLVSGLLLSLILGIVIMAITSCSDEDLLPEILESSDSVEDSPSMDEEDDQMDPFDPNTDSNYDSSEFEFGSLQVSATPCDFDLSTLESNQTLSIDCSLDLNGQALNLPPNVELVYDGGEIVNGSISFQGGKIDGKLLNKTLEVSGDVTLLDPEFFFFKERWDIVEGEVQQDVADRNRVVLREIFQLVSGMGANKFRIDELDAYFYGSGFMDYVFELPSNYSLIMTNNTHLRSQVNSRYGAFIQIINVENSTVSGGHIHGQRNLPGYDPNILGYLIRIVTGKNIDISNVYLGSAPEDGVAIQSYLHAYDPEYDPSTNVMIRGCTIDSNRRLGVSIVDGTNILLEDNTFINSGVTTQFSAGIAPSFAIDIEPVGQGGPEPLQFVSGVTIRNNREIGSQRGALVVSGGENVMVSGNTFEKPIYVRAAPNVQIIDNPSLNGIAIGDKTDIPSQNRIRNIIIARNRIENGESAGLFLANQDIQVFDNEIINCPTGIILDGLSDSNIYNNVISDIDIEGDGINAIDFVNNVVIENNTIDVADKGFYFVSVNDRENEKSYNFTVRNNTIRSGGFGIFQFSFGGSIIGNSFENFGLRLDAINSFNLQENIFDVQYTGIEIGNGLTDNLIITDNIIVSEVTSKEGYGILISANDAQGNKNIDISRNETMTLTHHNGVHVAGFDGIEVKDNLGSTVIGELIYYRGNNSLFSGNRTFEGESSYDVEGNNNTIN